jgi:hypothetical protein
VSKNKRQLSSKNTIISIQEIAEVKESKDDKVNIAEARESSDSKVNREQDN